MKPKFSKLAILRLILGGAILGSSLSSLFAPGVGDLTGAVVGSVVSTALIKFAHII